MTKIIFRKCFITAIALLIFATMALSGTRVTSPPASPVSVSDNYDAFAVFAMDNPSITPISERIEIDPRPPARGYRIGYIALCFLSAAGIGVLIVKKPRESL